MAMDCVAVKEETIMNDKKTPKQLPPIFFFDVESGGLDENTADIIEIAGYRMQHRFEEQDLLCLDEIHRYVLPRKPVDPEAAKINGYDPGLWAERGAVYIEDVLPDVDRFLVGATPGGQNPDFDMRFLTAAYESANREMPKYDYHLVDVGMLAWPFVIAGILPGQGLRYSCEFFGLGKQVHSAKDDIDKTIAVYMKIMSIYTSAVQDYYVRVTSR